MTMLLRIHVNVDSEDETILLWCQSWYWAGGLVCGGSLSQWQHDTQGLYATVLRDFFGRFLSKYSLHRKVWKLVGSIFLFLPYISVPAFFVRYFILITPFPIWDWVFICVHLLLMVDSVFDNSFIWRQIKRQPLCESAKLPTNLQSTPFEEWGDEIFLYKYSLFSLICPRTSVRYIVPSSGLAGSAPRQSLLSRLLHHRTVVSGLSDCQHDNIENTEKHLKSFYPWPWSNSPLSIIGKCKDWTTQMWIKFCENGGSIKFQGFA